MTDLQKKDIVQAIDEEKIRLGSFVKVATKVGVSEGTISQMRNGNWELIKDTMWQKVAQALGCISNEWQLAETLNFKMITNVLNDAKNANLFMAISYKAGSGKTATLSHYAKLNNENFVFYIQAREWAKREFLKELCQTLGIKEEKGYTSVDKLGMKVIRFFTERKGKYPLLIVDEADKLKPSALRWFITLYNELEDEMGLIIAGTENLEKTIKQGVRYNKLGFDEIDSRFGRKFINNLIGARLQDVEAICVANGISDRPTIKKIFDECEPSSIMVQKQSIKVVEDLRRLKRVVKRELIRKSY
ncbi:ATP-binding protein [Riemerella anatipestifer]|nr:ATP-binding protein [Riemerella anatipestifer]